MEDPRDEDVATKVKTANIELLSNAYERARAYTNLVILGGYAGAFTIWNFSRPILTDHGLVAVALLLTVSLATFVLFEVFQMYFLTRIFLKHRAVLFSSVPGKEFLRRHEEYRAESNAETVRVLLIMWSIALSVCVLTALLALSILLDTFFATLFGWPVWP